MKKTDLETMKKMNRTLVLNTIRSHQPISRAALSRMVGLSRSTVSAIVEELLNASFIVETGYQSSTKEGGRKAIGLEYNPDAGYGVGIDIGGTKVLMIVTNLDGKEVARKETPTVKTPTGILDIINDFIHSLDIPMEKIVSMGIGLPGFVDLKKKVILESPNLGWNDVPFSAFMDNNWQFPVAVNNDVKCAAFGEKWLGSAKSVSDFFFAAIGTGFGSAIVTNNRLVDGYSFSAGEVGYFLTTEDIKQNRLNQVGEFGVFEKKTSGSALSSHGMTGRELFQKYHEQDTKAVKIIEEFLEELAVFFANIASLLNPEKIIIGGGVSRSLTPFIDRVNQRVSELTPIKVSIELSSLGGDAGAIGAIAYSFENQKQLLF